MPPERVEVPDKIRREVRRILILVGLGALSIVAAVIVSGLYVYRVHNFQTRTMAAIEEVTVERDERRELRRSVMEQFLSGRFEELDRLAHELRTARATYPSGHWKLTDLYDTLGGLDAATRAFEWEEGIARATEWAKSRPKSVTPRVVLAEQWMAYAWGGRMRPRQLRTDDEETLFSERLLKAREVLEEAGKVEEGCPHEWASTMRLVISQRVAKETEAEYYEGAIEVEPDYPPYHVLHLFYLEPFWQGEAGDWSAAVDAILSQPGGPARLARTIWHRRTRGNADEARLAWPLLKQGFEDLVATQPDSFEVKSAYCVFAVSYRDLPQAQLLLEQIGPRMDTSVWRDRKQFAEAHRWATFESAERTRDPLARFFARMMR